MKSEIRNPKAERSPKSEIRKGSQSAHCSPAAGFKIRRHIHHSFILRASDFFRISVFGLRISAGLVLGIFIPCAAFSQQSFTPHLGYVYPAGGRQGSTFQLTVGGQFLDGANNVFLSGTGLKASVVDFSKPMTQGEFNKLRDRLRELQDKRQATFREGRKRGVSGAQNSTNTWTAADETAIAEVRQKILKNPPNRQATPAIAETVTVKITLGPDAEAGDQEIRLGTPTGLSNPLKFCVGRLAEVSGPPAKAENPDLNRILGRMGRTGPTNRVLSEQRVTLPATMNGQIMPGAIDRYRFAAHKGQRLVAAVSARDLIPYLADAVPGWFQATVALYDSKGHELAYDDDFRFHPDPVLYYEIPRDGEYVIEIKDAIYRGREDFVYRLTVGELPYITGIYPLGGKIGETTKISLKGWNLQSRTLTVTNEKPGMISIASDQDGILNRVPFAVDTLPECEEKEDNDSPATAQNLMLPIIVNGRINHPGDQDVFRLEGQAGQEIVAEVYARRLDSPIDSTLALTDTSGKQIAFNDDCEDKSSGLNTHHADSYLRATLPSDGAYFLRISDAQRHGGDEYAYRLRVSAPCPDFALRITPASINVRPGLAVPLTVFALRKDGFTNAISLALNDAPSGFRLAGGVIPAGVDQVRVTLTAPSAPSENTSRIELEGSATICGRRATRAAIPAEDMMQAFAYRHLVPEKELVVSVSGRGGGRPLRIIGEGPVSIPAGGTARVQIASPAFADRFQFELSDPPEGISIKNISPGDNGTQIIFTSDASKAKPGMKGNLIVNVLPGQGQFAAKAKRPAAPRKVTIGTLPAVPFEIVSP
jgi:hypothetical protein